MSKKDEALKLAQDWYDSGHEDPDEFTAMIKEVIALAEESSDTEQPAQQQEPVAYSYTSRITGAQGFSHHPMPRFIDSESWDINPLYTCPPASKPWVGLTKAEIDYQAKKDDHAIYFALGALWAEAKLREKNA